MSYFLIFILLISINCQEIPEKWEIDKLWKFVNEEISKREYNSSGLIDPNKYIHNETFEEFEDYLKSLNEQFGVCIFFTVKIFILLSYFIYNCNISNSYMIYKLNIIYYHFSF